jgi:hypothetical protein
MGSVMPAPASTARAARTAAVAAFVAVAVAGENGPHQRGRVSKALPSVALL